MEISQARIDANRKNAQKSTGPRTAEGKAKSRANALKHALCASQIVPEDAQLIQDRSIDFYQALCPQNQFHASMITDVAVLTLRIERCGRMERRARDKIAIRAELCWDDDRKIEAIALGETLHKRPAMVVEQLKQTPHGCEWLIGRWAMLAYSADSAGATWTDEQTQLAFDLLGTPEVFRAGLKPGVTIDLDGRPIETEDYASLARRQIDGLKARIEVVGVLDEANQALAIADLSEGSDLEIKRIRRYEATLRHQLRLALAQIKYESPHEGPLRGLMARWLGQHEAPPEFKFAASAPAPAPAPEPVPVVVPKPVAPVLDFAQDAYYGNTESISMTPMIHEDDRRSSRKKLGN